MNEVFCHDSVFKEQDRKRHRRFGDVFCFSLVRIAPPSMLVKYNERVIMICDIHVCIFSFFLSMSEASATPTYAGIGKRFLALILDGIINALPLGIISLILPFMADPSGDGMILFAIGYLLMIPVYIYNSLYLVKTRGASIGKKALGIQIVAANEGEALGWKHVLLRELLGRYISAQIIYIGYLFAFFTEKKQTLHDMIGGTIVVKK